MLAESETVGAD